MFNQISPDKLCCEFKRIHTNMCVEQGVSGRRVKNKSLQSQDLNKTKKG